MRSQHRPPQVWEDRVRGRARTSGGINTWSHIWFCSDRLDEGSEITFKHCHFFLSMWQQQEGGEWMLLREGNVISLFKIWLFLGNKHNRFAGKVLFKSSGCIQSNSSSSPPLLSDSLLEVMATVKTQRYLEWLRGSPGLNIVGNIWDDAGTQLTTAHSAKALLFWDITMQNSYTLSS